MPKDLSAWGPLFIVGLDGPVLLPSEARMLHSLKPSGIIIFAKNIAPGEDASWLPFLEALISDAREAIGCDDIFVAVDHEGGRVFRFRPPVTHFPYARNWTSRAAEVGRAMGRELRALGFNLDFAPVLDIHSEPQNEVIGLRAFGTEPEEVANAAIAFAAALQSQGVLSCGKHFPGHGATIADSHFELPILNAPLQVLITREVEAFRRYIETNPPLLMSAHVRYPQLDAEHPATTSKRIITDFLRGELGFQGALISDDLEMKALAAFPPAERAEACLRAGIDILLPAYSNTPKLPLELAVEMAEGLISAKSSGRLSKERIDEALSRVSALRERAGELRRNAELAEYPKTVIGAPEHQLLLDEIRTSAGL